MKKLLFIYIASLLAFSSACSRSDGDIVKPGVSLPPVTGLTLVKVDAKNVKLTWTVPKTIPDEIQQPLSVNVEVKEIVTITKTNPVTTANLADAATEFAFELPDPEKTYHFTVKVFSVTKQVDKNYSSSIYSLGQTVVYTR